jgi:hypothetical protein
MMTTSGLLSTLATLGPISALLRVLVGTHRGLPGVLSEVTLAS